MIPSLATPTAVLINYRLDLMEKSWRWLADKLGVNESMLSHIRTGRRSLSADLMCRVSEILSIPLSDLEYARGVQNGSCELKLDTTQRRACALAILRVWSSCSDKELGQLQKLVEKIHIEHVSGH